MRAPLLLLCLLPLSAVRAQEAAPLDSQVPCSWTVEKQPVVPGARQPLNPCLWLPRRPRGSDQLFVDVCGRSAAMLRGSRPAAFVDLYGVVDPARERKLDPARAVLVVPGGRSLATCDAALGDRSTGRTRQPFSDRALVRYRFAFPRLDPAWAVLELRVPWADGKGQPLVVRFLRYREKIQRVQADLDGWIRHTQRPEIRRCSAIAPWVSCAAARRFLAHGEQFTVPFLLRELARVAPGRAFAGATLPRFVVFDVLAKTGWGQRNGVPNAGADAEVLQVLGRWRRSGIPSLPGVNPHREVKPF